MRKLMTIAALLTATTATFAACDREDVISESKLPAESRKFLRINFDGVAILSVVRETDGLEKDYSVYLKNGFKVDFRRSGDWDSVDSQRHEAMPVSVVELLPTGIAAHVAENYPDRKIVKISREQWGYEIELDGGQRGTDLELDFTGAGEFFRYDD